ncbi:MAG TPA: hypothetical protein PLU45_05120, partial [Bacteroidales bacterium]|nr:hypothetical protein [Bacteroidales bacterium]
MKRTIFFFVFIINFVFAQESQVFYSLHDALKDPEKVHTLHLRNQDIKEFPKQLFKFPNLMYLDISDNQIQ